MGKGVIGETYTFTILFIDDAGQKFDPDDAHIEVFYFDNSGTKVELVPLGTPLEQVVGEFARYKLTILIPNDLTPSIQLRAILTGDLTARGVSVMAEEILDLFYSDDCDREIVYIERGLNVSFTRPK